MKFFSMALVIFISLSNVLLAQLDKSAYYDFGQKFYVEAYCLPTASVDSMEIVIVYRISHEIIAFSQTQDPLMAGSFWGNVSVEAGLRDGAGIIRRRAFRVDTVYVSNYEETVSKTRFVYGMLSFTALWGNYELGFQINDKYAQRVKRTNIRIRRQQDIYNNSIVLSPVFVEKRSESDLDYIPFLLDGAVSFSSRFPAVILPVTFKPEKNSFQYIIKKLESGSRTDLEWETSGDFFAGIATAKESAGFEFHEIQENYGINLRLLKDKYEVVNKELINNIIGQIMIELPSQYLVPGDYELGIILPGIADTAKYNFKVVWENQPISMKNIDYAIEMMYYILNDEEYNNLKRGSNKERFSKLLNYWKAKDPTRSTPYNEAMAEYFGRVDYAFFNYQTATQKDGAKTDRGKIHILYGSPDKVENALNEGRLTEIWNYQKLNKRFFFEAVSSGVFRLLKIQ